MEKKYEISVSIYQAYNLHLEYCAKRNLTPKTLDQFRALMA